MKKATGLKGGCNWIRKQCSAVGTKAIFPLLEKTPEQILRELVEKGFEAIVVVVNPEFVDEKWLGHRIDKEFITEAIRLNRK